MRWFIALVLSISGFFCSSLSAAAAKTDTAIFAGGCFWCMQADFDKLKGVVNTTVGYTGGVEKNPTYQAVSSDKTGHYESVKVEYNPAIVTYPDLLNFYWHHIDPTDAKGQFCDKGPQYRSVIFYGNASQKQQALASKHALIQSGQLKNVYTQILPQTPFYAAEDYHQDYYKKNPLRYKFYRYNCGRDKTVEKVWGTQ